MALGDYRVERGGATGLESRIIRLVPAGGKGRTWELKVKGVSSSSSNIGSA